MKKLKNIYFVGNAHIDPVWMWRWQEGSAEAKATIRSVLDRLKEYPEFVFVCGCSSIFEWIEEYDPEMFAEVQEQVKAGRFVIVNGWFVQPDCNLPSGEGFARQSLYGQRYFKEKFGVTAKTGYNVDSFGHCGTIPQILVKSGMDSYVALRPQSHEMELPSHVFRWRAADGSEVIFGRLLRGYNTTLLNVSPKLEPVYADDPEHMQAYIDLIENNASEDVDSALFLYGVGNHGGGPTKKNIESILTLKERTHDANYIMSDTRDFFEAMKERRDSLAVVQDDLQHHAAGCYSAVWAIKDGVRKAEWAMFGAENFSMLAKGLMDKKLPQQAEFARAWKNILFAHFHDCLGGCSAKAVYEDSDIFLKESRAIAQRAENNALQSLSWKIDTSDPKKGIPMIFFNPHGFDIETVVTVPKRVEIVYDRDGNEVPTQIVRSPDSRCRKKIGDTIFKAKLPALGYSTYYFHGELPNHGFTPYYFPDVNREKPVYEGTAKAQDTVLENEYLRVTFENRSGYICSIFDKLREKELLAGKGAVPVVIDEYGFDTWAHKQTYWTNQIGQFHDAKITVLDKGPIRAQIKVESIYNGSTLTQYFTLHDGCPQLEVYAKIDWHEKHKMLKIRYDTIYHQDPHAFYEIPFGVIERPANGEEEPGQSWIAVKQGSEGMALINNNKYSFSVRDGSLNLSVVRSPYYIDHARGDQNDPESEYTDQGEHSFHYAIRPLADEGWGKLTQAARLFNLAPTLIVENNHKGTLPDTAMGLKCDRDNVILTAWKPSEDGKGMILRAYETEGKETKVTFSGSALPAPLTAVFKPWSIQTYYLETGSDSWKEVMLTEYDYE